MSWWHDGKRIDQAAARKIISGSKGVVVTKAPFGAIRISAKITDNCVWPWPSLEFSFSYSILIEPCDDFAPELAPGWICQLVDDGGVHGNQRHPSAHAATGSLCAAVKNLVTWIDQLDRPRLWVKRDEWLERKERDERRSRTE